MADADRCVMCGAIIPEGRIICPTCESRVVVTRILTDEEIDECRVTADNCPSDCRWHGRHQKCSCCRRNKNLKDCYERSIV